MANEQQPSRPSILTQAEQAIATAPEGISGGVIVKDGKPSAEVSAKVDIGKKGGWTLGGIVRAGNEKFAALLARWTPKDK